MRKTITCLALISATLLYIMPAFGSRNSSLMFQIRIPTEEEMKSEQAAATRNTPPAASSQSAEPKGDVISTHEPSDAEKAYREKMKEKEKAAPPERWK